MASNVSAENKAIRDYLDLHRDWAFDLYANHGLKFDEINRALVHFREPWISASRLQSAIERWKKKQQPQVWPEQQPPRTTNITIPPRPPKVVQTAVTPETHVGHLSLPAAPAPHLAHPDPILHHSAPPSVMHTSTIGLDISMSSAPQTSIFYPYLGSQGLQRQQNHVVYHYNSQTPLHNKTIPSQTLEADPEQDDGSVCENCGGVTGVSCQRQPQCFLWG